MSDKERGKIEEGQVSPQGRGYGRTRSGKVQSWNLEAISAHKDRALKHWKIAASAGHYDAMQQLQMNSKKGVVSRESINSTLTVYNKSCAEMRSEARDAYIHMFMEND